LLALLQTYKLTGHSDELIHLVQQSGLGDKVSDFAASNCDALQRMCLFLDEVNGNPAYITLGLGAFFARVLSKTVGLADTSSSVVAVVRNLAVISIPACQVLPSGKVSSATPASILYCRFVTAGKN